ncbi:MAG: serine/threonine-protein kinase, partial [Deltaproteobacteria bacterium]|nr:serine/threonine-protein kinase [Deltaproteobacteria bacterium]
MSEPPTPGDSAAGFSLSPGLARVAQPSTREVGMAQEHVREALFGERIAEHRVDRFTLLDPLGRGGMGVVYAAYDPQLDRRVALKLLRTGTGAGSDQQRLVVEARAMAKVSHPNVVTVFEVGEHDGEQGAAVFVAMEFVRGKTLREWTAARPRSWARVIEVYRAAGRGLSAVHEAGLVHRDFKPDNVMIDDGGDDRVRVMDFGLAHDSRRSITTSATPAQIGQTLDAETRSGRMVGTPAYMAPEQLEGRAPDHRSDQYAFCVSVYEALWGQRPWQASSVSALALAVLEATRPPNPPPSAVPAQIRRAVLRGLARDPRERWPSMPALLRALGGGQRAGWKRRALGVGAVATIGGLALWAQSQESPCREAGTELDAVWNEDARASVRSAFASFERDDAVETAERVTTRLDTYAEGWQQMRRDSCEATHVQRSQSSRMLDLRTTCLETRRLQLASLVSIFASADDPSRLEQATPAVGALPPLDTCADLDALTAVVPPPEDAETRAQLVTLKRQQAEATARLDTGDLVEGVPLAKALVADAEALGYAPMQAEAELLLARILRRAGKPADALVQLERAALSAAQGSDDRQLARIWSMMAMTLGGDLGRSREALGLAKPIEAAVLRAGSPARLRAGALLALGNTYSFAGQMDRATAALSEAVELRERELPDDVLGLAVALSDLSVHMTADGERAAALEPSRRALQLRREALGDSHLEVARSLSTLSSALRHVGELEEARQQLLQALAIYDRTIGRDNRLAGLVLNNLGLVAQQFEDDIEARRWFDEALAIFRGLEVSPNADEAMVFNNLAVLHERGGRHEEGIAMADRARETWVQLHGDNHKRVAIADANIGSSLAQLGRYAEAAQRWERALSVLTPVLGRDHRSVVMLHIPLSDAYVRLGRAQEALVAAQVGYDGRSRDPETRPGELADAQFGLAMALWAVGEDRQRAVDLA